MKFFSQLKYTYTNIHVYVYIYEFTNKLSKKYSLIKLSNQT